MSFFDGVVALLLVLQVVGCAAGAALCVVFLIRIFKS